MSSNGDFYIPEGFESLSSVTRDRPELTLTDSDKQLMDRLLSNPLFFPKDFKTWLLDYIAVNIPDLPISHIFGYSGFAPQEAPTIATGESTTSTSYTNLTTVGPTLAELADARYWISFGALCGSSASGAAQASIQINSDAVSDDDRIQASPTGIAGGASCARAVIKTLAGGTNSVTMKYKSGDGSSVGFSQRWMILVKLAET